MLRKIKIENNQLVDFTGPLSEASWIELYDPTLEERTQMNQEMNISLPLHHEMSQIEFSNRFYVEQNALYLSINVITKAAPIAESHMITMILTDRQIVTLRFSEPNPILNVIRECERHQHTLKNHFDLFILLLDKVIGVVADIFELIEEQTDELTLALIGSVEKIKVSSKTKNLKEILKKITYLQNLLWKGYQSLNSVSLLIDFVPKVDTDKLFTTHFPNLEMTFRDVKTLQNHSEYLSQKITFQLQSSFGLINNEQTQIITIFTILAMIFMPPTLVASIYGMNFHHIPELTFTYGYPVALLLMLGSALLPYLFIKKKKWV